MQQKEGWEVGLFSKFNYKKIHKQFKMYVGLDVDRAEWEDEMEMNENKQTKTA